ncbi:hypothetical protein JCM24511_08187 [Saitozyma sp. JCM 24511]|nr:hypothetical protein JCM24511_08187 [Saitozyma sp. JCM 24511]
MCHWDRDVRALGEADPTLIPLFVKDPELEWCQTAYNKAINRASGPALVEALRRHLPSFRASPRDYFVLRDGESMRTIMELCSLRAGRGPEFLLKVEQEDCQAKCRELPDEIHLDVVVSKSLFAQRQAP